MFSNKPYRVAFSDIDGTLLIKDSNDDHILNPAVVEQLRSFDEVYLFTQRSKFVLYGKASHYDPQKMDQLADSEIAHVLDLLRESLPGKTVKVSTSLDEYSGYPDVGGYYESEIRDYESDLTQAIRVSQDNLNSPALNASKEAAFSEIEKILNSPAMLEKCYKKLLQKLDELADISKGRELTINKVEPLIKDIASRAKIQFTTSDEYMNSVFQYVSGLDHNGKKELLYRVMVSKQFVSPLQDKVDHYNYATGEIRKSHPNAQFTIFEDSALNLAEIESKDWGDRQPVGVLVVGGDGLDPTSSKAIPLTSEQLAKKLAELSNSPPKDRIEAAKQILDNSTNRRNASRAVTSIPLQQSISQLYTEFTAAFQDANLLAKLNKSGRLFRGSSVSVSGKSYKMSKKLAAITVILQESKFEIGKMELSDGRRKDVKKAALQSVLAVSTEWLESVAKKRIKGLNLSEAKDITALAEQILNPSVDNKYKLHAQIYLMLNPILGTPSEPLSVEKTNFDASIKTFNGLVSDIKGNTPLPQPQLTSSTARVSAALNVPSSSPAPVVPSVRVSEVSKGVHESSPSFSSAFKIAL